MLTYALVSFAVTAAGGLILAMHVLRGKLAPWALSLLHAGLGALGLVLLGALVIQQGAASRTVITGFSLLVMAALGGFLLASFHLRRKVPPRAVVVIHAAVAVTGVASLLTLVL